jgi:hypothetical protein
MRLQTLDKGPQAAATQSAGRYWKENFPFSLNAAGPKLLPRRPGPS